jgi:hypothetical protein
MGGEVGVEVVASWKRGKAHCGIFQYSLKTDDVFDFNTKSLFLNRFSKHFISYFTV